MHTQVVQLIILAVTSAALIAIVWFGYRSHLKELERLERESERWDDQLSRQRKNDDLNSLMRQATKKPEPRRSAATVRATDTGSTLDPLNPLNPLSPLHPMDQQSVSNHRECSSRNHRHDPTPSFSHCDSSSSSSSSSWSSSDSGSSSSSSDGGSSY